jgi:hypothetical protein
MMVRYTFGMKIQHLGMKNTDEFNAIKTKYPKG